jgi:tRNA(fMet)-specific endonuclease VapC
VKPRYLLDTDICIYIAKRRPAQVQARLATLPAGAVAMSVITYGELWHGATRSQRSAEAFAILEHLARAAPVLTLDEDAARHYGEIRAVLESKGRPIGNNDLWIAAHARAAKLTLVTNNEREFSRVDGLAVENWAKKA